MTPASQIRLKCREAFRHWLWRVDSMLGLDVRHVGCAVAVLLCLATPAYSEFAGPCSDSSLRDLKTAIEEHNEHVVRLNTKFKDIWYPQGPVPAEVRRAIGLEDIKKYLANLGGRKTAVLFYGFSELISGRDESKLHTWLITSPGKIICAEPRILAQADWETLQPRGWSRLGVRGAQRPRAAIPLDNGVPSAMENTGTWTDVLHRLADILLPREVVGELNASQIDTLVIVPITVHGTWVSSTVDVPHIRATFSIGMVPFAALPIGDGVLMDKVSVVISPGFFSFARDPVARRDKYSTPIVVGNPMHPKDPQKPEQPGYPNLPGAEAEAQYVAKQLGTTAFVKETATRKTLEDYLRKHSKAVDFIHLATHGDADAIDPVDKSFLVFTDEEWNARNISKLRRTEKGADVPLLQAKPLVVMSACQTALGKDFPAGTIGLARAWQWAGASNVVMSLWSVDDEPTKELMMEFVDGVMKGLAVDKALQAAMLQLRGKYPNPSHWASFAVYGAPERLEKKQP